MVRLIETVPVVGKDGRPSSVVAYQHMIRPRPLLSGHQYPDMPGLIEYFDESGRRVNAVNDKSFQVVVTGEILTRS